MCGGVAFASHSSKAATRLVVNHSPEPFTNIGLSIVEDLFIPFGIWLSLKHPILTFGFVAVFLAIFLWVSPKIFRLMKLQLLALGALISNALRASSSQPRRLPSGDQGVPALLAALRRAMERLPERYARVAVEKCGSTKVAEGLKCAAGKSIRSLRNSVGYLLLCNDEVVFLTQRNFRYRIHRIGISEIRDAQWRRGILLHRLILKTADGESTFYVFR